MFVNKRFIVNEQLYLQKLCIDIIEEKLNHFFDTKIKLIKSLYDLYISGSIRTSKEILTNLQLSDREIIELTETIEYTIRQEINQADLLNNTDINIQNYLLDIKKNIDYDIRVMTKTEQITGIYESILHKALSDIIDTFSVGKILNYIITPINLGEIVLGSHSHRKQMVKHGEILAGQIQGNLLNLKTDLRNELIKSALASVAALDNYLDDSIVA